MKIDFEKIENLKKELDKYRPFNEDLAKMLREDLKVRFTYNSNAIEGNTLTIYETKVILEDGITVGGKSLREHLEVINHADAIGYIEELVLSHEKLSKRDLMDIHRLVLKGIDNKYAGTYRDIPVIISGVDHIPPSHIMIPQLMEDLLNWYSDESKDLHPIERASILHGRLSKIHPFKDGNGRTSRLILNFELMKNGYLPVVIEAKDKPKYIEALAKGDESEDYLELTELVYQLELRELERYTNLFSQV
ncbi:Fic family protein [uncultured Ilyobacter sp.]|nr:Fic family protein [uncultured Ilyobacter sp.]